MRTALHHLLDRVFCRLFGDFIEDWEDLLDISPFDFRQSCPCERRGNWIQESHFSMPIRCDYRVANAGERGVQQIPARGSSIIRCFQIHNQPIALRGGASDIESRQARKTPKP